MFNTEDKTDNAFTIVELIAVLSLLGVLLFFATPNFLKSNEKSTDLNIKNNIMVVESKSKEMMRLEPEKVASWQNMTFDGVSFGNVYSKEGKMENWSPVHSENPYLKVPESIIEETLLKTSDSVFFINKEGTVYNVYNK